MTALLIVPLLAFTGFAVDLGAWYARASAIQSAADAAALAGVTYMPNVDAAETVALDIAAQNGFPDGGDYEVEVEPAGDGNTALRVTITETGVDQYFTSWFTTDVEITRSAVAEYVSPVSMGSPEDFLGNDPVEGNIPYYWLVTFGTNGSKQQGDRYHVRTCTGALIGCTGSANNEFISRGYFFTVTVPEGSVSDDLHIQIFDPWFYDHNNSCGQTWLPTNAQVTNFPGQPTGRFQRGATTWCTGDSNGVGGVSAIGGSNEQGLTVIVREPSTDPFDPTAGDIVCAATYEQVDVIDGPTDGNTTANEYQDFKDLMQGLTSNATNSNNNYGPTVHIESGGTVDQNHTF
jgi:hypothetical protein